MFNRFVKAGSVIVYPRQYLAIDDQAACYGVTDSGVEILVITREDSSYRQQTIDVISNLRSTHYTHAYPENNRNNYLKGNGSALLFSRCTLCTDKTDIDRYKASLKEKVQFAEGLHVVSSAWVVSLWPGKHPYASDDDIRALSEKYAPYQLGYGYQGFQIGEYVFDDSLGYVELPKALSIERVSGQEANENTQLRNLWGAYCESLLNAEKKNHESAQSKAELIAFMLRQTRNLQYAAYFDSLFVQVNEEKLVEMASQQGSRDGFVSGVLLRVTNDRDEVYAGLSVELWQSFAKKKYGNLIDRVNQWLTFEKGHELFYIAKKKGLKVMACRVSKLHLPISEPSINLVTYILQRTLIRSCVCRVAAYIMKTQSAKSGLYFTGFYPVSDSYPSSMTQQANTSFNLMPDFVRELQNGSKHFNSEEIKFVCSSEERSLIQEIASIQINNAVTNTTVYI